MPKQYRNFGPPRNQKTPDERALENQMKQNADAAIRRADARKQVEAHLDTFVDFLRDHEIACLDTTWQQAKTLEDLRDVALRMECGKCGGTFERSAARLRAFKGENICPHCANATRGKPDAVARMNFAMRVDEQGMEIDQFTNLRTPIELTDRLTRETVTVYPKNIQRWQRVSDDRQVYFVADADDYVFLWMGDMPIVRHPFIAQMLADEQVETYEGARGAKKFREAVKECLDAGDRVVNMSLNESWKGFGQYAWGDLPHADGTPSPLTRYFDEVRETWDG